MKTQFIPIEYDYFDWKGKNHAKIIGRNEKGKRLCIIDTCDIYFWAILKPGLSKTKKEKLSEKIEKIEIEKKGRTTRVQKTEIHQKKFLGEEVEAIKIFATNYKDLHDIADELDFPEIRKRRGYDLGFITHYIIEKKLSPLNWHEISGEILNNSEEFGNIDMSIDADNVIKAEKIKELDKKTYNPKVLTYDIECDAIGIGEGEILMISLVSENFRKVITWKKTKQKLDFVEYVEDEAELLEKFVKYVREISPDFLIGYFSDGFDLPYLRARAEKFRVKLALGLDESQPKFSRGGAGITATGKISGIVHLDLFRFIRTAYSQYMQSETLSLQEVSNEFLGEKKKDFKIEHSSNLGDDGIAEYIKYNLQDSVLVYKLFEKMWPDMMEFSRVMKEPIFEVSRNGMSKNVESYILHNLERFNEIPEKRPQHAEIAERRHREKYVGAFVFQPNPGMYEEVAMFDFTSYWPSIIVSFNLSKSTLLEKKDKNSIEVQIKDEKAHFTKNPGFFPEMLKEIILKRKQFKKELKSEKGKEHVIKKARSNAFKLLANSSYGYQGFFGARYYCPEASASTTAISREYIQKIISLIDKEGYKTIYSDTDSIAFLMQRKTKKETLKFLDKLNSKLPGIMELELEDFYKRGIWVSKRTTKEGAKKKYAMINEEGKMKIRGFETVRRDWCKLARELQNRVINKILEDGNEKRALDYTKEIIKKIKDRDIENEKLIIKTQLKKPISEYRAISPHVVAAKKMKELEIPLSDGNLIQYYVAETHGKKLVRERVKLPQEEGKYDIKYYLERQILPAVENIFHVFGIETKEIIDGKKQTTLGDF